MSTRNPSPEGVPSVRGRVPATSSANTSPSPPPLRAGTGTCYGKVVPKVIPGQLAFDLDGLVNSVSGTAQTLSLHHVTRDGAGRLLVTLARQGLREEAYRSAAALVLMLDQDALDRRHTTTEKGHSHV